MVGSNLELNMEVTVWNDGEDSYGTTVTFFYPPGLSYRRVAGSQVLFSLGKEVDDGWGSAETTVLISQLRLVLPLLRSLSLTKRSGLVMVG